MGSNNYGGTMRHTLSRATSLTLLAASVAIAGCKGKESAAVDTTAAMTKIPDTTAVTAPPARLSDANIAGLVDEVNVADSTLAAAALPKLTDKSARDFAKLMMGEHHALHLKGTAGREGAEADTRRSRRGSFQARGWR